ncbi:PDZ domain-containing protein [Alkalibacillus flavidus]|uniref:endopeptidase La n=1 Tax=Alkalibacillus flavidus TaxID=546021 RepID=A0ABV2KR30_9BACI
MLGFNKKHVIFLIVTIAIATFISFYKLDYYIYQPGDTTSLSNVIEIEGADSEVGRYNLVTVRGGQATPAYYIWASFQEHYDIVDLEQVRPNGISQEEYMETQLHYMENSQEAATVVAYEAAGADITIDYNGTYVAGVLPDMPAADVIEPGDEIIAINGYDVESTEEIIERTSSYEMGDEIDVTVLRNEEEVTVSVELAPLPQEPDRPGMGVSLVTDREVTEDPEVEFNSGQIGGPSAGLMFSLAIYDQLTDGDLTNGLNIVGTGEMSYSGDVGPIGGIDKKIVAAEEDGADIFFAPNENGQEDSNYSVAVETAEEIDASLEVVPVDTFQDAVDYLESLDE